jgi:hypothetical protein
VSEGSVNEAAIGALVPLFRELVDLKRLRAAHTSGSIAQRLFLRAWARWTSGEELSRVAREETARALIATKLAAVDAEVLGSGGLDEAARRAIFERAFEASSGALEPNFRAGLGQIARDLAAESAKTELQAPEFALLLANQPRAGATRPGFARVVLEPAENHAEHCAIVAVGGAIAAPFFGAAPEAAFLTGLCHHFHNADLPDAGDAGDHLIGEHLSTLQDTFRARAIAQLPGELQCAARASLDAVYRSDTPESRAFQTADVLDRVLEMEWHARSAAFTLGVALEEMDIVHPGPVQAFQAQIMRAAGLR